MRWSDTRILLVIAMTISVSTAIAQQDTRFINLSSKQGLSQNSVIDIAQDPYGFLWFATQDGLNKYDGFVFEKYNYFFEDVTTKEFSQLGQICPIDTSRILLATIDGKLQTLNYKTGAKKLVDGIENISCVIHNSDSNYFVSSYSDGLVSLNFDNKDFRCDTLLPDQVIYNIVPSNEKLYLCTDQGLFLFDVRTKEIERKFEQLRSYKICDVIVNDEEVVFIATFSNGLYKSVSKNEVVLFSELPKKTKIEDLLLDSKGRLWIATYGSGLYEWTDNKMNHHVYSDQPYDLSYNDILCVYEDVDQNIWFGTDGGGVCYVQSNEPSIRTISSEVLNTTVPLDVPRAISTDNNKNIWIGTSGKGLAKIDSTRQVFHYSKEKSGKYYIPCDRIVSLYHDEEDFGWIGTQGCGLLTLNDDVVESVDLDLPAKTIWRIDKVDKNLLALCTREHGLVILNTDKLSWKSFDSNNSILSTDNVRTFIAGKDSENFYGGTDNGQIFSFNLETEEFTELSMHPFQLAGVKSLALIDNHLWVGTVRSGIVIYNLEDQSTISINQSNGLPSDVVYSILEENENNLWISCNNGLAKLDRLKILEQDEDFIHHHFTIANGIIGNEFNTGAYHRDSDGNIYFGAIEGITWFHPSEVQTLKKEPKVLFTDLIIDDGKKAKTLSLYNKEKIDLDYSKSILKLSFKNLEYSEFKKFRYKYKLEGYHQNWIEQNNNEVILEDLKPGLYQFKLLSTHKDGSWSDKVNGFDLQVHPKFWQTILFKIFTLLVFLSSLWMFYTVRINEIRKFSTLRLNVQRAKAKALQAQINPHFIFNCLNSIDSFIINNDPLKASEYLTKFSKLIRKSLDYSNRLRISLTEELSFLELYVALEQMRFPSSFNYNRTVEERIALDLYKVPPMIIQPYVENAIWHGIQHKETKGNIDIEIKVNGENVVIEILDDGIGRAKSKELKSQSSKTRKSYGMSISSERIDLFNELTDYENIVEIQDVRNDQSETIGTRVILTIGQFISVE